MDIDHFKKLQELEKLIGCPPGGQWPSLGSTEPLKQWLNLQGIPFASLEKVSEWAMKRAYQEPKYLAGWLRKLRGYTPRSKSRLRIDHYLSAIDDVIAERNAQTNAQFSPEPSSDNNSAHNNNHTTANVDEQALKEYIDHKFDRLPELVSNTIKEIDFALNERSKAKIIELVTQTAQAAIEKRREIRVIDDQRQISHDVGHQHKNFDLLLKVCSTRLPNGFRPNIWLTGPTGSGKTHAVETVAKCLSTSFHADSSLDADYKITGFIDANGNYHTTQFRQAFENGGIYLADEIDNWEPSALLAFNAPLANGWGIFPDKLIKRHPDFLCIACANTWGLGATSDYVGRAKLDAATLNRFIPKLDWPYDEDLEHSLALSFGDEWNWARKVQKCREYARISGTKIIISTRDILTGISLLRVGFPQDEVIAMTFCAGLPREQLDIYTALVKQ
jgi:cobaltochelatase CobS